MASEQSYNLQSLRTKALIVGILGLLACFLRFDARQSFQSYLLGYLFWLLLPLGSLAVLMLHHMVGGGWGFVIRRVLEAGARTILPMALLFVPLLFGAGELYPWADPEKVAADHHLAHKAPYLNFGFFLGRAVFYFFVWGILALLLSRWSFRQDEVGDLSSVRRLQIVSGGGLVLFGLTTTFASVDWAMSLEPHWFSTIYGAIFIVGSALSSIVLAILALAALRQEKPLDEVVTPTHFQDLGKLLLTFIMLWAYIAFSQYLIIWSGNLAEEVPWYLSRGRGGWQYVAVVLVLFHFAVPFALLLSRKRKRSARRLVRVAALVLLFRFVDMVWIVVPAFHPEDLSLDWLDFVAPIGIGGLWLASFLWALEGRPLLPLHDPRFEATLATSGGVDHG